MPVPGVPASSWIRHLPNLLSGLRLAAAPLLLLLAAAGAGRAFVVLLALTLATDLCDGYLARRIGVTSEFGARLDSWGDLLLFFTVPAGAMMLWPELVAREAPWILLILSGNAAAALYAWCKFRRLPAYHTMAAKVSAVLMGVSALALLLAGEPRPFRVAALVEFAVCIESLLITRLLTAPRADVGSLRAVLRARR